MYNYTITGISGMAVLRYLFAAGVCMGGMGGLLLGLLEKDAVGFLGGMFVGLAFGLVISLAGLFCVFVFNMLAPYTGGIRICLEKLPSETGAGTGSADGRVPIEETVGPPAVKDPDHSAGAEET